MDEQGKIELLERAIVAWNSGDLSGVVTTFTEDHEWDMTRSGVPGETAVHRGHDAYLGFAQRWREALGPTQLEIEEARELPDGRLYVLLRQTATGARSGADIDLRFAQIITYEDDKMARSDIFLDLSEARAEAGFDD